MKFQLPEDPKERTKWLVIIGIVAVVVLVLVGMCFNKIMAEKKAVTAEIEKVNKDLKDANMKIELKKRDIVDNAQVLAELKEVSDKHLLKSVLGNSLLVARDIIAQHAKEANVQIDPVRDVRQIGEDPVPCPGGKVKGYTVKVTTMCGYHDLVRLIRAIEKGNPYLCVTGVFITGQRSEPYNYKHQVSFDVQWPTWMNADTPATIDAQLKEEKQEAANAGIRK